MITVFNSNITQPKDKGILLKDIIHENHDLDCVIGDSWANWFAKNAEFQLSKKYSSLNAEKAITLTARQYASWNGNFILECLNEYIVPFDKTLQILDKEVARGKVGYFRKDSQANRVYYIHDKAVTLCGDAGGGAAKMGQYLFGSVKLLNETGNHFGGGAFSINAKSPTISGIGNGGGGTNNIPKIVIHKDDEYLFGCITPDRINKRQNGQRFSEGKKFYTLTAQDKHGILIEGYIRKLTPIECERLQTVPDNYTQSVSNSQRYKMLGNGWTIDIISHILKELV